MVTFTIIKTMTLLENIESKNLIVPIAELKQDRKLLKEIQIQLERLGFYPYQTNTDPDGIYGPRTSSAIDKFCESVHLNCSDTGIYGPSFATALMTTKPNETMIPTWWDGGTKNELASAVAKDASKASAIAMSLLTSWQQSNMKPPIPTGQLRNTVARQNGMPHSTVVVIPN
jgi:peptidoglycan hydrolase-like protein with peptidoglycan-binding domain